MSQEAYDRLEKAREEIFKKFYESRVLAVTGVLEQIITDEFRRKWDLTQPEFAALVLEDAISRIIAKLEDI